MEAFPAGVGMQAGDILQGKYRVERLLGRGGMGFVVAAHHLQLDEKVAIKSLLPEGRRHPETLARFEREGRAAAKIKSENIARVLDVARFDDGTPFLVMEHLDGSDCAKWLQTHGRIPVEQAVEFIVQACDAIGEAHALGIVHRDLKPANLFVVKRRDGRLTIKVLDFGISKMPELGGQPMTGTRALLGSPEYMSPEQFHAPKTVDARTDIWSIGATLYELLSGQPPFTATDLVSLAIKIANETPQSLSALNPAVPPALNAVVMRCLHKDRAGRFQHIPELVAALTPFTSRGSTQPAMLPFAAAGAAHQQTQLAPTQAGSSWPSDHPAALASAPTIGVQPLPLLQSAPPPAMPRPPGTSTSWHHIVGIGVAFAVLVVVAASVALVWAKHSAEGEADPVASSVAPVITTPPPIPTPPEEPSEPPATPTASATAAKNAPFTGTHAVTRVSWHFGAETYRCTVTTNGKTGFADVSFVEPGDGPVVVRENLTLQQGQRGWAYVGSNPRYKDDGEPANFIPNVFILQPGAGGTWKMVETCALGTQLCAPLTQN